MLVVLLVLVLFVATVLGIMYVRRQFGYTFRDYLVLGVWLFPVLLLKRFSFGYYFTLLGPVYRGLLFGLWLAWLIVFMVMYFASPRRTNLRFRWAGLSLAVLFVVGLVSGVTNEPTARGLGAPLHAHLQWAIPLLLTFFVVAGSGDTLEANERLRISYVIAFGYVTAVLIMAGALFRPQMAPIFGWEQTDTSSLGFTRAFTPLGSAIASGIVVSFGYALCLGGILQRRHVLFHLVGAALSAVALLFTLSRGCIFVFILINALMMRGILTHQRGRIMAGFIVLAIFIAPIAWVLSGKYDFRRLLQWRDTSSAMRVSSALAAMEESLAKPVLGHGPGLLYEDVRLPKRRQEVFAYGSRYSAGEPHNAYALIAAENGFAGLALELVAFGVLFVRARNGRKLSKLLPAEKTTSDVLWAVMLASLVFCWADSGLFLYSKSAFVRWSIIFVCLHHVSCLETAVERGAWAEAELAYPQESLVYA